MNLAISADHGLKLKEGKKRNEYLDLAEEAMEHEGNGDTDNS